MENRHPNKKREKKQVPAIINFGKVPPQAVDIEKSLLGACTLDPNAIDTAAELLAPEMFYSEANKVVFEAMLELSKNSKIDVVSLVQELMRTGNLDLAGGAFYVSQLSNGVTSSANLGNWARIISERFLKRELITMSGETLNDGYDDTTDVFDLIERTDKRLSELVFRNVKNNYRHVSDISLESIMRIEELRHLGQDITGIPSSFTELDRLTHGWQPTDLIILAARPSVGKTAFALNLARNAAINNVKPVAVGFFSLEMSAGQLVNRLLSAESGVPLEKLSTGKLEEHESIRLTTKTHQTLSNAPIFIDDTASITISELRAKARKLKKKENVGLIIIDYLQLMSGDGRSGNREQEISKISRELKGLAKELKVPIIALSQLSRETEKRSGDKKVPQLSDLRESGAIEQDADMVMFMYRPEYYDVNASEMGESTKGETHIKIAKHRNGSLDTVKLKAVLAIQKFYDADPVEYYGNSGSRPISDNPLGGSFKPIASVMNRKNPEDELPF